MKLFKYSIIFLIIFSLVILSSPEILFVFALDTICTQAKNVTCESKNIGEISDKINKCQDDIIRTFYNTVSKCESEIKSQVEDIEKKEKSAEWYLSRLNLDIRYLNYEIANLNLSISQLESEIEKREKAIKELNDALAKQKEILTQALREVYEYDITTYVEVFLGYDSLSDFGAKLVEMESLQQKLRIAMKEIQKAKDKMEKEKEAMEKDRKEKLEYKKTQEYSRYSLAVKQEQQEYLLEQLTADKTPLEQQMILLGEAMAKIQNYLSFWFVGDLTWAGIFNTVNIASRLTGVRSALLMGLLRAETIYGTYLSSCKGGYKNCMNSREAKFFEQITSRLCKAYGSKGKFNYCKPETLPVSKAGAMGFAQIIPSTFELDIYGCKSGIKSAFSGEEPSPYFFDHAMVGMATYIGNAYKRYGDERRAIFAYNPAEWYVNNVMEYTALWEDFIKECGGLTVNCSNPEFKAYIESFGIPKQ